MIELSTSVSLEIIEETIISLLSSKTSFQQAPDVAIRSARSIEDWQALQEQVVSGSQWNDLASIPFYFGLGFHKSGKHSLCGLVTFYIAYSTWDGRVLFVDHLQPPKPTVDSTSNREESEKEVLRILAQISVNLGCSRLAWNVHKSEIPQWFQGQPSPPEILHEWLTLRMGQEAMTKFVGASPVSPLGVDDNDTNSIQKQLDKELVHSVAQRTLEEINQRSAAATAAATTRNSKFRLRLASGAKNDVATIARLVKGLAIYEKEPDAVNMTAGEYRIDGGSGEPLFYCLLVDHEEEDGTINTVGMALTYFGYRLVEGRFLYLEDLFFEEAYRKRGAGSLVLQSLARLSLALACQNLYWVALDWNTPALNFYSKIGATVQDGVLLSRYCGVDLQRVAEHGI